MSLSGFYISLQCMLGYFGLAPSALFFDDLCFFLPVVSAERNERETVHILELTDGKILEAISHGLDILNLVA